MTRASFSSPSENLIESTEVSILGKVLAILAGSIPFSKGAKRFGSNVSVCAIPPPIHKTITVSAVGVIFASAASAPRTRFGNPAARAESVAELAVRRKSRRFHRLQLFIGQ